MRAGPHAERAGEHCPPQTPASAPTHPIHPARPRIGEQAPQLQIKQPEPSETVCTGLEKTQQNRGRLTEERGTYRVVVPGKETLSDDTHSLLLLWRFCTSSLPQKAPARDLLHGKIIKDDLERQFNQTRLLLQ